MGKSEFFEIEYIILMAIFYMWNNNGFIKTGE